MCFKEQKLQGNEILEYYSELQLLSNQHLKSALFWNEYICRSWLLKIYYACLSSFFHVDLIYLFQTNYCQFITVLVSRGSDPTSVCSEKYDSKLDYSHSKHDITH